MRVVVAGLADFYYYRRRIRVVNYNIQIAMATVSETSPEKKKKVTCSKVWQRANWKVECEAVSLSPKK